MVMQLHCKFLKDYSLIMDRERFLWRGLGGFSMQFCYCYCYWEGYWFVVSET
jgi:hypothetical protein